MEFFHARARIAIMSPAQLLRVDRPRSAPSPLSHLFRGNVFYFNDALQRDLRTLVRLPDPVGARGLEQAKRLFLRWQKGRAQIAHWLSLLGHLGSHGLRAPGRGGKLLRGDA